MATSETSGLSTESSGRRKPTELANAFQPPVARSLAWISKSRSRRWGRPFGCQWWSSASGDHRRRAPALPLDWPHAARRTDRGSGAALRREWLAGVRNPQAGKLQLAAIPFLDGRGQDFRLRAMPARRTRCGFTHPPRRGAIRSRRSDPRGPAPRSPSPRVPGSSSPGSSSPSTGSARGAGFLATHPTAQTPAQLSTPRRPMA